MLGTVEKNLCNKGDVMKKKDYDSHYSDSGFQEKVRSLPKSAGTKVLRMALTLYVLLKDPDIPVAVKVMIIGYFIFPPGPDPRLSTRRIY